MAENVNSIEINHDSGIPLIQQIREQITWLIVSGKIKPGDLLPSVRLLAKKLAININTVRNAYQLLERDNLIVTKHGTGSIVLAVDPVKMGHRAREFHSNTIGVILPEIKNPFYHTFLQGVEVIASANQTMMLICHAHDDPQEALRFYSKLIAKHVDGIICASLPLAEFLPQDDKAHSLIPFVSVDWPDDTRNAVQIDLEDAAYLATSHLIEHGYKRIAMMTFREDVPNTMPLKMGYERAFQEKKMKPDPELIVRVPGFSLEDGISGMKKMLSLSPPPDAIFAISDSLALGAMKHLKEIGLRIPEDVAIIGVDDIFLSEMIEPQLTTVALPARQLGIEAMKMLEKLMKGEHPEENLVILPVTFVERQSCGHHK